MEFDRDRFRELVLYISWQTKDDPKFGRIKLAKVLFFSDLAAYADTGEALTGARYVHREHGPFPPVLYDVETRLHGDLADVQRIESPWRLEDERETLKIFPYEEPEIRSFDEWDVWQRHLVDSYIKKLAKDPSWKVSDDSHKHPGWLLTEEGEDIPYHVAFMSRRRPTKKDFADVEQLARDHGW